MPITTDELQGRLRLGQGMNRAAMPQSPSVIPRPLPDIPHIRPTPSSAPPTAPPASAPVLDLAPVRPIPQTPPVRPQRLAPAGFALDLTPKGKKADLAGRGAAMLMRGNLAKQLVNKNFPELGKGERDALATLHSPEDLYKPSNAEQLDAIIRPGPVMAGAIQSNPTLQHNRAVILQRLQDVGQGNVDGTDQEKYAHAVASLTPQEHAFLATMPAKEREQWVKTTYEQGNANSLLHRSTAIRTTEPSTSGTGALAAAMAHSTDYTPTAGRPVDELPAEAASFGTGLPGITQKFATGAANTALGIGPGLVDLATHDPRKTLPAIGKSMVENYKNIVEHPERELTNDPFNFVNSAFGAAAGGFGAVDRASAVADALKGGERGLGPTLRASMARGPVQPGEIESKGVAGHTVAQLKELARERDLPVVGKKQEIFDRVVGHERQVNNLFREFQGPGEVAPASAAERMTNALHAAVFGRRPGAIVLEHNGTRVVLPASKSAIGRSTQVARYSGIPGVYKGLLQRLDHEGGFIPNDTLSKIRPGIISADARFGRLLGKQGRMDQDLNSALSTYMMGRHLGPTLPATIRNLVSSKEDISALRPSAREARLTRDQQDALEPTAAKIAALARGNHVIDLHNSLYHSMGEDDPAKIAGPAVAIKPPNYKDIKAENFGTEAKMHDAYSRIAEYNRKSVEANPNAYRYVHKNLFEALRPFNPTTRGVDQKLFNGIDRATQLVRAGRFLHPGYLAWAVQNGILHTSQAGMFALRNAWQLRNHYSQFSDLAKANLDAGMGAGMARATTGETPFLRKTINGLGKFWHGVDDAPFRRMSGFHEMNREGIHTAAEQEHFLTAPEFADARRAIFQRGRNESIDYSAMTPAERATIKKVFTAYGWTRGATAYTARFPLEHPVQQQLLSAVGKEGSNTVNQYYAQHGGMPPAWLKAYADITHGNSPWLMSTGIFNPSETPARLIGEIPGLTHGQTGSLSSEIAPVPQSFMEFLTGTNQFGTAYKGNQRITGPISELAKRFEPWSALTSVGKKGGSTMNGPLAAGLKYAGVPVTQLRDATKTASLGQKDFEQSLSRGDLINFRAQDHIDRIPQEAAAFQQKTGQPVSPAMISRYKGAVDTIQHIQQFQQTYAGHHGSKTYKSLPAQNKVESALTYLQGTGRTQVVNEFRNAAAHMHNDAELEALATAMWNVAGQGATQIANAWKSGVVSTAKPKVLTPKQ